MKIAQTCQGDTLANLDQEGPNVKKQQKYVMQTVKHASAKIRGLAPGLWWQIAYQDWILPQNKVYLSGLSCVYIVVNINWIALY